MRGLGNPHTLRARLAISAATVAGVALSLGVAAPAYADGPVVLTAPYDSASHIAYCYPGDSGSCTATADAEAGTGHLGFSLSATAPSPSVGGNPNSQGHAEIHATYLLTHPAAYVDFKVLVHVPLAQVRFSGLLGLGSSASVSAYLSSADLPCAGSGCIANDGATLAQASNGGMQALSSTLVFTYRLVNQSGGDLPPGQISTVVGVAGNAVLGALDIGTVYSTVDATVTSITVTPA